MSEDGEGLSVLLGFSRFKCLACANLGILNHVARTGHDVCPRLLGRDAITSEAAVNTGSLPNGSSASKCMIFVFLEAIPKWQREARKHVNTPTHQRMS